MSLSFSSILEKRTSEIERPPLAPLGYYRMQVEKYDISQFTSRAGEEFDRVEFTVIVLEPTDDVDEDELQEFYDSKGKIKGVKLRKAFLFNNNDEAAFAQSEFNLKRFCHELHDEDPEEDESMAEMLENAKHGIFLGELRHRADQNDPTVSYHDLGRTMRDEE